MHRERAKYSRRAPALIALAITALCAAVWFAAATQRVAAEEIASQREANAAMLVTMLEQESGVRGFYMTQKDVFLGPYERGRREFDRAAEAAASALDGPAVAGRVDRSIAFALDWQAAAQSAIADVRAGHVDAVLSSALERKAKMDGFRAANAAVKQLIEQRAERVEGRAALVPIVLIVLISAIFGGAGYLLVVRGHRAEQKRRLDHRLELAAALDYAERLALARSDREIVSLLRTHIRILLPGVSVAVMPAGSPAAEGVSRFALKAGAEKVGWVDVRSAHPLSDEDEQQLRQCIAQASPALENQVNLARAEQRASTDGLTGLPNARAVDEALLAMVAQAHRSGTSLAALMLDLDHFKSINDRFGHDGGNDVLAAVAKSMRETVRAGDFVGRFGGEEFTILLPDTDRDGALVAAEKVRAAIEQLVVPGIQREITASIGVAVLPDQAMTAADLVRAADQGLYAAKRLGRNQVVDLALGLSAA